MKRTKIQKLIATSLILSSLASSAFADNGPPGPRGPGGPDRPGGQGPGRPGGPGPRPEPPQPAPTPSPEPAPAPAPTPAPTPAPEPAPAPTPPPAPQGPTQAQIDAARALGSQEGAAAGAREAQERAPQEGRQQGYDQGRRQGFENCSREMADRARQQGFADGYSEGQQRGGQEGMSRGQNEGNARGQMDGMNDGRSRADSDALRASTEPGRQQGYQEANASDASARGSMDGAAAGDAEAKAAAEKADYPRGRKDFNSERQADPVRNNDSFNQKNAPESLMVKAPNSLSSIVSSMFEAAEALFTSPQADFQRNDFPRNDRPGNGRPGENFPVNANPDNRYNRPGRTMPSQEETNAYNQGFAQGYPSGFRGTYDGLFQQAFQYVFDQARREGCQDAQRRDYSGFYGQGRAEGRDRGYNDAYKQSYDMNYRSSYDAAFRSNSDSAYRASYQGYYQQHFEEARSQAYREQYDSIYSRSRTNARDAKYAETYPLYQKAAYERGRADEAEDFRLRPVRLLSAEATETIVNGIQEPGEPLRVRVKLRNYSDQALLGRDIQVTIQAQNSSGAVISEAQSSLVKDLSPQSVTLVGEALEFRLNENTVGSDQAFRVAVTYQGRPVGSQTVTVKPRFLADLSFASAPELKEGLPTTLQVRVKNNGTKPLAAGLIVKLQSSSPEVEILKDNSTIDSVAPGQSKIVSFTVIGRGQGMSVNLPVVLQALEPGGRRIGLINRTESMPVTNDYRISVRPDTLATLRNGGVARVEYVIQNINSRILLKGLSLKVTFPGTPSGSFVVIGPNPQYLEPVLQGQRVSFLVPVLATSPGLSGTMQLEVKEDGRTVVIDRNQF